MEDASSHHKQTINRSMSWLAKFLLLMPVLIAWQSCQANFNRTSKSHFMPENLSMGWNPHAINNASCPKFVLANLGFEGIGDQLTRYLYFLYLAKLLDATLVVNAQNMVSGPHHGATDYRWVAEHLFGINMKFNASYVRSVYRPANISLSYDNVITAKSKEIGGIYNASSSLLPCNTMAISEIYGCDGWCPMKRPFVAFTEVGWLLRQNKGYENCRRHLSKKDYTAGRSKKHVVKVVCHQHTLSTLANMPYQYTTAATMPS